MYTGALPGRRAGSLKANQSTGSLKTDVWPAGRSPGPYGGQATSAGTHVTVHCTQGSFYPPTLIPDHISHYKWGKWDAELSGWPLPSPTCTLLLPGISRGAQRSQEVSLPGRTLTLGGG